MRDEAAVGRDRNCLVPLTLDGSVPPLGFRQFQTIDLSRWRGRGHPPQLDELIHALVAPTFEATPQRPRVELGRRRQWLAFPRVPIIAAVAAFLVAVIGGGWWWVVREPVQMPTVAIEAGNGTEKSREVARDLAAQFGNLQPAGGGSFQLISGKGDADLILQIDASDGPKTLRRELSLLSNRSILWSTTLVAQTVNADDLAQDLPRFLGHILSCALEARHDRIDPSTLKLYLRGCSQMENAANISPGNYDTPAAKLFEQVVHNAPHFEGAWGKLLLTTLEAGQLNELKGQIAQVEQLGLNPGELYAVKASLLPAQDFLGKMSLLDAGILADPDSAELYRRRAVYLAKVGRMKDAISDAGRALQLDPFSLGSQEIYRDSLADAGEIEQAYRQLVQREAKWPKATINNPTSANFEMVFGDPKRALALVRDGVNMIASQEKENFILARIDPTPAKIQQAIEDARAHYARDSSYVVELLQVLGQFGRTDEAIDLMLHYAGSDAIILQAPRMFRPAMRSVWRDPRSMAAAAHLGLLRYWKVSGHWPDFCSDPNLPYNCKKEAKKLDANAYLRMRSAPPSQPDFSIVGSTARCRDGNISNTQSKVGTCGLHGGVVEWFSNGKSS